MLADSVRINIMKYRLMFRTVMIVVRFEDFTNCTRAKTVPIWTWDIDLIKKTAIELLSEFLGRELRLVGVEVLKHMKRS